jgi:hypothetical protein
VAAVVIAITLVVTLRDSLPDAGIVLAQAAERMENSAGVIYKWGSDRPEGMNGGIHYQSAKLGYRQDIYRDDVLIWQNIANYSTGLEYAIDHRGKTYVQRELPIETIEAFMMVTDPLELVKGLTSHGQKTMIGRRIVDGVDCFGVEVVDSLHKDQGRGIHTTKVWVDATSMWPVRIEMEVVGDKSSTWPAWKNWSYDFQWDPVFADSVFSPTIPEGYEKVENRKDH